LSPAILRASSVHLPDTGKVERTATRGRPPQFFGQVGFASADAVQMCERVWTLPSKSRARPKVVKIKPSLNAVGNLKRFKRIALRCEKTVQNYGSFVALALGFILIKSVHTA
jgi:hypothetical protein